MPKTIFCTIVSASYINQALSAVDSLQNYHKEFDYLVTVIDLEEEYIYRENNLQIESLHKLIKIFPEIKNFNSYYSVIETICALKPFVTRFLLNDYNTVIYGDSDTFYYNHLSVDSGTLSLEGFTPHRLTPSAENNIFANSFDISIIKYGYFNLGFFVVTRKDLEFLDWWMRKLMYDCLYAPELFLFVDQKWIDLGIHFYDLSSIKDETLNIGPWNLDERIITKEDGQYYVNRKKLSMIHFSGVSESNPTSHLENFYSLEKEISSELQGSLVNFKELSHEWLNYQFNVHKRHEELIVRVLNLKRKTFSHLSFFKRAKKIEQLRSGKLIESRSNFISRQINKIGYKMDLILSNSNSYKYGRTYISSDLKKIRLLINRFVP
jgi:hypothetical protein